VRIRALAAKNRRGLLAPPRRAGGKKRSRRSRTFAAWMARHANLDQVARSQIAEPMPSPTGRPGPLVHLFCLLYHCAVEHASGHSTPFTQSEDPRTAANYKTREWAFDFPLVRRNQFRNATAVRNRPRRRIGRRSGIDSGKKLAFSEDEGGRLGIRSCLKELLKNIFAFSICFPPLAL